MSILLDALRKSEQGKRPLEAPTIHSVQHDAMDSESLKKGPLSVLLLLAFVLIAWVVWRQYEPPAMDKLSPVVLPAKPAGTLQASVSPKPETDPAAAPEGLASQPPVAPTANQQRTPVEHFQPTAAASNKSESISPDRAQPNTQIAAVNASQSGAGPATTVGDNNRTDKMRPQPISYWELPDAIRADLPEMKFSVLVYAGDPADRFVLMNGQRLAEGDSYQQGLVVEEIRRDGVVFSYRLYQFLVAK